MTNIAGAIIAAASIIVYLISVLITGSLWGPFVFIWEFICEAGSDVYAIC